MSEQLEANIRAWMSSVDEDPKVPIIYASSPAHGALLAPILAHTLKLDAAAIKRSKKAASQLLWGKPPNWLMYKGVLSHEVPKGSKNHGPYCQQPGGRVAVKMMRALNWPIMTPNDTLASMAVAATAEDVRARAHLLYKRRVRYHAYVTTNRLSGLGDHVAIWPNKRFVVTSKLPTRILRNNNRRFHSLTELAVTYEDGWGFAAVDGVLIPKQYIQYPETLTVDRIKKQQNVEVKRGMVELFGYERYLGATNAHLRHQDVDQDKRPRKLWLLNLDVSEWSNTTLGLLEVFNSTPESDGTHKKYFLQVPGHIDTINTALHWMLNGDIGIRSLTDLEMRIET